MKHRITYHDKSKYLYAFNDLYIDSKAIINTLSVMVSIMKFTYQETFDVNYE